MRFFSMTTLLFVLALGGCSDGKPDQQTAVDKGKHATLFKEPVKALDKANEVQKKMDEAARKQAGEVERQTQ